MVFGWFLIHPCPYPEPVVPTDAESGVRVGPGNPSIVPDEASQLIPKDVRADPARRRDLDGLTMMRTIDFWVLFWIMSLRECLSRATEAC
jgi:hypothetical protein